MWAAVTALHLLTYHGVARLLMAAAVAVSTAAVVVGSRRWARGASLSVDMGELTYRGLGEPRVVRAGEARRIVVMTLIGSDSGRRYRRWAVLDADGNAVLSWEATAWAEEDLQRIADACDVPVDVDPEPRKPHRASQVYPRSVPWWQAHPFKFAFLAIAVASLLLATISIS